MLISLDQLKASCERYETYKDVSVRSEITELESQMFEFATAAEISPEVIHGNIIGDEENLLKRMEMLKQVRQEPHDFAYERAIGKNDSVYSNFIELMLSAKKKVGRIVKRTGIVTEEFASGFMITDSLLMTNWHVFRSTSEVSDSVVQFEYELDVKGNPKAPVTFTLDENRFFHSVKELDYCVVAVKELDNSGEVNISSIGFIDLNPMLGKLGNEKQERLNIIHHPNGDYKQLSIRQNQFEKIMPTTIWYKSDTAPGSSGGPVFNDQWQPVALHHMGVAKKNDRDQYLDKEGNIIPVTADGKIDVSRVHWIANEGIRISVIVKDLFRTFPNSDLIAGIRSSTNVQDSNNTTARVFANLENKTNNIMEKSNINISFPPSVLDKTGSFNINLSNQKQVASQSFELSPKDDLDSIDALLQESKKLEKEYDYSQCKGYQENFLGRDNVVPLPMPKNEIMPKIAKLLGANSIVLNYFKFSSIHHAERKMPLISAINIDGNPELRKDTTERKDRWIRDRRLDFFVQLDTKGFYRNSGFDKGHMSRREDANWGSTAANAKRNADLTCVFTNACPQVPSLNRGNWGGLWGKLENIVLEKGAIEEGPGLNKISVFNGPIFKESDPLFKGIKIPTEYFKIVLWIGNDKKLKSTAFKLSQVDLIENIDLEALDIDRNIKFKPFQCSIKSLEKATKIDFSGISKFDTFKGNVDDLEELDQESFKL